MPRSVSELKTSKVWINWIQRRNPARPPTTTLSRQSDKPFDSSNFLTNGAIPTPSPLAINLDCEKPPTPSAPCDPQPVLLISAVAAPRGERGPDAARFASMDAPQARLALGYAAGDEDAEEE